MGPTVAEQVETYDDIWHQARTGPVDRRCAVVWPLVAYWQTPMR